MKLLNRLILVLLGVLFALELAHAETAGDLNTQGRASFIARDGYNLFLGNEGDDDFVVVQNNVTTFSIDGATGAVTFSGTLVPNLPNNTYLTAKNAAGSANIDVLKVDATDDTVLNADTGDTVKLAIAGTSIITIDGTGLIPTTDGNNATSNLGSSVQGFKNIYLSDATRRGSIFVSNGLYVSYPSGQGLFFREASTDRWSIATSTGDFVGYTTNNTLRSSTSDAADNQSINLAGGGTTGSTRGAYIGVFGNEYGSSISGDIDLRTGDVADAEIVIRAINASGQVRFQAGGSTNALTLEADQDALFTQRITSSRTTDLGWSAVNAANQACNTTCTSACVFGMNTGALGNFVGCADATADTCICAGAS